MTTQPNTHTQEPAAAGASTSAPLPFEPADLAQGVRVTQADFARMTGVSRQTVSQWVKLGKIRAVYPDGTLDPARAAREVIKNTDPSRLRAKIFRVATEDAQALRGRVATLERELDAAKAYIEALINALPGMGISDIQIEYLEWLATGESVDTEEDSEPPALPLFEHDTATETPTDAPAT